MARFARVVFSDEQLDLLAISRNHDDIEASVRSYFLAGSQEISTRFATYSPQEIEEEMHSLLREHERCTALNILAALEAAFRIDYLQRCYQRKKDKLSRALREVYARKGQRATLDDDILQSWKDQTSASSQIISYIRGAFRYRHWLAHGRYWTPKLGQQYDYQGLYILAEAVFQDFPLEGISS